MEASAKQNIPKIHYGLPLLPFIDSLYQILVGAIICAVSLAGVGFIVTGALTLFITFWARKSEVAGLVLFFLAFLNVPIAFAIGTLLDDVTILQFYAVHSGLLLIIYGSKAFKDTELIGMSSLWRHVIMVPCWCAVVIMELVSFYSCFASELDTKTLLIGLAVLAAVVFVLLAYRLFQIGEINFSGILKIRASTIVWAVYSVVSVVGLIVAILLNRTGETVGKQIVLAIFAYLVACIPAYFLYLVGQNGMGKSLAAKILSYVVAAIACIGICIGYSSTVPTLDGFSNFLAIAIALSYIALAFLYAHSAVGPKWHPYLLPVTAVLVPIVMIACICYFVWSLFEAWVDSDSSGKRRSTSTQTVWEVYENGVKYEITEDSNGNYFDDCNRQWKTNDGGTTFYRES